MAITHNATIRASFAEAVKVATDAGSSYGKLVLLTSGDAVLAEIVLQDPAWSRTGAVLTLLGVPLNVAAAADGTIAKGKIVDSDDNTVYAGTAGLAGSDFVVDNTSVTTGQNVKVNSATYTASL